MTEDVAIDNNTCKEYFSLKDELPVKLVCNSNDSKSN